MTDPRPICPIPPDAKVGDVVVLSNGERRNILKLNTDDIPGQPIETAVVWLDYLGNGHEELYCIAFEYADGRKPAKPKRTQAQRDAAYIRETVNLWHTTLPQEYKDRMLAIADRLEKQQ